MTLSFSNPYSRIVDDIKLIPSYHYHSLGFDNTINTESKGGKPYEINDNWGRKTFNFQSDNNSLFVKAPEVNVDVNNFKYNQNKINVDNEKDKINLDGGIPDVNLNSDEDEVTIKSTSKSPTRWGTVNVKGNKAKITNTYDNKNLLSIYGGGKGAIIYNYGNMDLTDFTGTDATIYNHGIIHKKKSSELNIINYANDSNIKQD